ncbi:unnamed protein product [Oreochromis niloticus]|nr:unnamed protein product [Mustela putorius furo]
MSVLLVGFLSTVVLHSVSAGGAYCAKTARARAAALGLDYPGVHGAPDLSGPAHHGIPPHPYNHEWFETVPNMATPQQNRPTFNNVRHRQANLGTSDGFLMTHGTYRPVQSEYATKPVHGFPREQSVSNRGSSFKGVKRVALPTLADAPGQFDLVNRDPQGHSVVYSEHDLVVDESVPNRRGIFRHALSLPQSWGHGAYQRALTVHGKEPVLGSNHFNEGHGAAITSSGPPMFGSWRYRFPGLNVKQFVQGTPTPWWSDRHEIRSR